MHVYRHIFWVCQKKNETFFLLPTHEQKNQETILSVFFQRNKHITVFLFQKLTRFQMKKLKHLRNVILNT